MKIDRRSLLKGGAVAGGIAAAPMAARAFDAPALIVFDSRSLPSRAFAFKAHSRSIDIAREDANLWRNLRSTRRNGRVEGLTSWSDWVLIRGLLEERGLRVKQELKTGTLFRWTMA